MLGNLISDNSNDILKQLGQAEFGAHYIIVYHDMIALRQIYSGYTKAQLENNQIVLILPYYETTEMVRSVLSGENHNSIGSNNIIDARKYEKEESLMIIDSVKAYFDSDIDLMSFVGKLSKQAQNSKSGVSVIADLASFYFRNGIDKLIEYEMSLPTKYDDEMKLKGFCLYHQEDFKRFSKEQKQKLLEHHGNNLMVVN
jgi:hypothetical protein